jgi:16S rRNA (cytosine967-C5)-methyltransferase
LHTPSYHPLLKSCCSSGVSLLDAVLPYLQSLVVIKVVQRQADLLQSYSKILKEGGKMVYATCSILPRENQEQVQAFLATEQGQKFELEKEETVSPAKSGYDGFYMALLSRKQ